MSSPPVAELAPVYGPELPAGLELTAPMLATDSNIALDSVASVSITDGGFVPDVITVTLGTTVE